MDYTEIKREICEVGRMLYDRGYVISNEGNLSVRIRDDELLVTPAGVGKGRMEPDMLVHTDLYGRVLSGSRSPSSETKMHLAVYRNRPDVTAVIHAHPPFCTAFAVCRRPIRVDLAPEGVVTFGEHIPLAPYGRPSTEEVPNSVMPYLSAHNAVLLSNHGVLVFGTGLLAVFDLLETVEALARLNLNTELLGGGAALDADECAEILKLRSYYASLSPDGHA